MHKCSGCENYLPDKVYKHAFTYFCNVLYMEESIEQTNTRESCQMIDYRFYSVNDVYVVWIAGINRYVQLLEPAFGVFGLWAKDTNKVTIADWCASRYSLSKTDSLCFVDEIVSQMKLLMDSKPADIKEQVAENPTTAQHDYFTTYNYRVGIHVFRFIYRDSYLEDLFHPLFKHYITDNKSDEFTTTFELYSQNGTDILTVNEGNVFEFPAGSVDRYQGAVFMEILNTIHNKQMDDWMGVIHASAVTDGKKAVLFTAPSGSGKSTIAMLMMAQGYASLSDDFVPVAIQEPEVYHFPTGISVKPGAADLLKEQLPQLQQLTAIPIPGEEVYVAPASSNIHPSVPACAIVFVKYDSEVAFDLKREPNLGMMNDLIRQSWIAGTPEAAERFLHWYLNLPVYSLRYSDNKSAVEELSKLFG